MIEVAVYDTKPYDRRYLEAAGESVGIHWRFNEFRLSADSAVTAKRSVAVCVFVNDRLDRPCLETLAGLGVKLVALRCAGFNNVDLDAATELGVRVVRVPAYSPYAVAEHTVALLLTLNRRIHRAFVRVREHNFSLNGLIGSDIHGKTVGIVGTGKIGKLVARIFGGFGARIIAHDPYPDEKWADENDVQYLEMKDLLPQADIVTLHMPLTPETLRLLNEDTIGQMKQGAYLINTSRGKLIETKALIGALKSGRLGGVALDVYEEEEGVFFEDLSGELLLDDELSRLLTFPNVLVTAHQAFLTDEALSEIARVTVENIGRFDRGEEPLAETSL